MSDACRQRYGFPGWHNDTFLPDLSAECSRFHDALLVFMEMHVQRWAARSWRKVPSRIRTICPWASCTRRIRNTSPVWRFSNLRNLFTIDPYLWPMRPKNNFLRIVPLGPANWRKSFAKAIWVVSPGLLACTSLTQFWGTRLDFSAYFLRKINLLTSGQNSVSASLAISPVMPHTHRNAAFSGPLSLGARHVLERKLLPTFPAKRA